MTKAVLLVLVLAVATAQVYSSVHDDLRTAAEAGNWDEVRKIFLNMQSLQFPSSGVSTSMSVGSSLSPQSGGKHFGVSEYSYHSSTNNNGEIRESSGGHKIIDDNGKITEYNFTPGLNNG